MDNLYTGISKSIESLPPEITFSYGYIFTNFKKLKWPWLNKRKIDNVYLSNHFFFILQEDAMAYAIEVLIFFSSELSVFYISKADSTGFFNRHGSPSPLKAVISTFLSYLIRRFSRKNIPSRISLFSRSQPQYLFPSSSLNPSKHILDDRELVRWWLKVLDSVNGSQCPKKYVLIPGMDPRETLKYTPQHVDTDLNWICGHPYESMGQSAGEIIPRFPDDPKTRFLDQLDRDGEVVSIDKFWELMAFRQECIHGRIVGFFSLEFPGNDQDGTNNTITEDLDLQNGIQINEKIYRMVYEKLLRSDFETLEKTKGATLDLINDINNSKDIKDSVDWIKKVSGKKTSEDKKRKAIDISEQLKPVNILNESLIRKKSKKK
ncbi:hypothetical protein T552_00949 [Pneumocystis carinii B80]|uniref:histone acetyltransferase n=1 Tax=Pneumocystis carinii (strain B80) TaxID=1408658 RepID=A0A0W4ZMZ2_PNEC8|nr:hypothetical protein T552_00949 [Pneumocystis carinii B80]KTW29742.1 hypothetical protein T552_00949 [Pneumocystis carinii B80]